MTTRKWKRRRIARALLSCLVLAAACLSVAAQKKPAAQESYALIGGTVFRDTGFSLPGAKVILALESQPTKKLQEQISSPTGQFAFRVKPGPNRYTVSATLKGFQSASKTVEITGQEQVLATLMLVPESNKKGR